MPRHPPIALSSLLFHYKDARVHCAVLKKRAGPGPRRRWPGWWLVRTEGVARATDPSGPNSVLGPSLQDPSFHSLAGCT